MNFFTGELLIGLSVLINLWVSKVREDWHDQHKTFFKLGACGTLYSHSTSWG